MPTEASHSPIDRRRGYFAAKLALDLSIAGPGLVLLLPPMLLIALLVRLTSPGPALFRQLRSGRGGAPFTLYKFRTMASGSRGPNVTEKNDPRLTRFGAFLRRTKLDELPQLFNILKGDMSLVGPRPDPPEDTALYGEGDRCILAVRPGLTDIATIALRCEEEVLAGAEDVGPYYQTVILPLKLQLRKEYLKRASFGFDLKLLAATVFRVVLPKLVFPDRPADLVAVRKKLDELQAALGSGDELRIRRLFEKFSLDYSAAARQNGSPRKEVE